MSIILSILLFIILIFISMIIGALIAIPLFLIYVLFRSIFPKSIVNNEKSGSDKPHLPPKNYVDMYVENIRRNGRATFQEIILDSHSGNTKHAEIDELIISPFGVFCIEYKAHRGIIFGSVNQSTWTHCKYNGKKPIHNHLRQNYKHVKAIEELLGNKIKHPIESYVVYTNATDIHIDSQRVFMGIQAMEAEILKHNVEIYSIDECRDILEILVPAVDRGRSLRQVHIDEVNEYLITKKYNQVSF